MSCTEVVVDDVRKTTQYIKIQYLDYVQPEVDFCLVCAFLVVS